MSLRLTQLDLDLSGSIGGESPCIIPRTPPEIEREQRFSQKRSSSAARNLLSNFTQAELEEDLANQLPSWLRDKRVSQPSTSTPNSSQYQSESGPSSTPSSSISSLSDLSSTSDDPVLLKQILKEVQNTNKQFSAKLSQLEKTIQDMQDTPLPKAKRKKISPSPVVRDMVRKVYHALSEEEEVFGWDVEGVFANEHNEQVMKKLVTEAKTQLGDTPTSVVKDAAKTYFNSVSMRARLKKSRQYTKKCTYQRRKNRMLRKLKRRQAVLAKTAALTPNQKKNWSPCLVLDVMSSEESDADDDDDENARFTVHPIPWRSDNANSFLLSLDQKHEKNQSKRSKIMSFHRVQGLPSDRPRPKNVPAWVFKPGC